MEIMIGNGGQGVGSCICSTHIVSHPLDSLSLTLSHSLSLSLTLSHSLSLSLSLSLADAVTTWIASPFSHSHFFPYLTLHPSSLSPAVPLFLLLLLSTSKHQSAEKKKP